MTKQNIVLIVITFISLHIFSQVRDYDETALIFSQEKQNGTARFLAMSGAYGAVGGDLSAVDVNPAGMAIFNDNAASISLNTNYNSNSNNFYNTTSKYKFSNLNFAQAGALMIFETGNDTWNKFAVGINTSLSNTFNNSVSITGNNHISNESFFLNPDPNADLYNNVEYQESNSFTYGDNTKTTFFVSSKINDKFYLGLSIISNYVDYGQEVHIDEVNKDVNDNTFHGRLNQYLDVYGYGIGFNVGMIAKPTKSLRLGLSYQTPSWYVLSEEFSENMGVYLSNADVNQPDNIDYIFDYNLRTPSKLTGSIAYIFNKKGLLSMDYTYKNYSNAKLSPTSEFEGEYHNNENINNNYQAVNTINVGGEYRLKIASLRAGYHFENNPYKDNTENVTGFSLGFGFKTGDLSKLDFSFNQLNDFEKSYFLNAPNSINSANKTNKFTLTYSMIF